MRILHVIYSVDPVQGGTVEALLQIVKSADGSHQRHEILTLDDPQRLQSFAYSQTIHAVGPTKRFYGYSPKVESWFDEHLKKYDCAIIHGCWQYHGLATFRACRKQGIPYFQYTHGMLDPWFKRTYPLKHLKKWLYWPWAEYRILKNATKVIFTCEEEERLAALSFWLYRVNPTIISLGIQAPDVSIEACKSTFEKEHPRLQGKRLLTFMSRIHEKKGVDLLIRAAIRYQEESQNRQVKENDRFIIIIAGPCKDAAYQKDLQNLAETLPQKGPIDSIDWFGMVRGEQKWGLLAASEAFILPSHQENFGMVVAESLFCKTPVLISNKVNIWKEVKEAKAALVEDDTLEGTLSLMKKWNDCTSEERSCFREMAGFAYESNYQIQCNAQKLFSLIDEVVKSDSSPAK